VSGAAEADDLGVDTQPEGPSWARCRTRVTGIRRIIAHCVRLYHRFPLSFRDVEELMLVRGVIVTHETIRQWCAKFGPVYAAGLRRRQHRPATRGTSTRCS
jgi:putative transposase